MDDSVATRRSRDPRWGGGFRVPETDVSATPTATTTWHDEGHGVWLFPEYDGPAAMKVRAVCACGHDFMPDDAEVDFDHLAELIEAHRSGSRPEGGDSDA